MNVVEHRFLKIRRTLIDVLSVESKREGILLYRPGRWWLRWIPVVMGWFAWLPWPGRRLVELSDCSDCSDCLIDRVVWEKIEETIGACRFVTIYLGNGSAKSKLTIKARLESGRDVIVKLGNTRAAADAIRNEWEVLKGFQGASFKFQVSGGKLQDESLRFQVAGGKSQDASFRFQVPEVIGEIGCEGEWTWSVQTVLPRGKSPNRLQKEHYDFLEKLKAGGVSHGDFAPWNCAIVGGKLVVWDWEDAGPWVEGKDEGWFKKQVKELLGVGGEEGQGERSRSRVVGEVHL